MTRRGGEGRTWSYRLGTSNIFNTMDVNNLWTELFAGSRALKCGLRENIIVLQELCKWLG